jgi:hypothetical protein
LLDSPELLAEFSRQARVSVVEKFGAEGRIAELEDCYEEAIRLMGSEPGEQEPGEQEPGPEPELV